MKPPNPPLPPRNLTEKPFRQIHTPLRTPLASIHDRRVPDLPAESDLHRASAERVVVRVGGAVGLHDDVGDCDNGVVGEGVETAGAEAGGVVGQVACVLGGGGGGGEVEGGVWG